MPLFIALFVIFPLVEIYVLIQVGQVIGALPTIGVCVLTAVLGGALLRQQGLQTLGRARRNLDNGELPAIELFEAVALALGGALLLTPGLVTDAVGFACLIPYSRQWLVAAILRRAKVVYGPGQPRGSDKGQDGRTIEGEFSRHDER